MATSHENGYATGQEIEGRFVVADALGGGPLTATYRAHDKFSGAIVHVQVVAEHLFSEAVETGIWQQIVRTQSLDSPYVAPPREAIVDRTRGRLVLVLAPRLELSQMAPLPAELARRGAPLGRSEAQLFVSQVALGLSVIHRAGLVHGDLRPENILIGTGHAVITGLGVAPALSPESWQRVLAMSTDVYRAPELLSGEPLGPRADVYALAVILAEMLGYIGPASSVGAAQAIDEGLSAALARALFDDPRERYPDVDTFAAALVSAFERSGREGAAYVPAVNEATERAVPAAARIRESRGEDEAFVAGALEVTGERRASRDTVAMPPGHRRDPKVVLDARALSSETPATPMPMGYAAAPHRGSAPFDPSAALATPPPRSRGPNASSPPGSSTQNSFVDVPTVQIGMPVTRPRSHGTRALFWFSLLVTLGAGVALGVGVVKRLSEGRAIETRAEQRYGQARELAAARASAAAPDSAPVTTSAEVGDAGSASPAASAAAPEKGGEVTAAESPPASAAAAPACPEGMKRIPMRANGTYCIATHEFPGAGVMPGTKVRHEQAERVCAARGARLCTRAEWENACSSGGQAPFSYGARVARGRCNAAVASGKAKPLVPTGELSSCRTSDGLYDMIGNAGEWVKEGVAMGGDARSPVAETTCRTARPARPREANPWTGFRCCAD